MIVDDEMYLIRFDKLYEQLQQFIERFNPQTTMNWIQSYLPEDKWDSYVKNYEDMKNEITMTRNTLQNKIKKR